VLHWAIVLVADRVVISQQQQALSSVVQLHPIQDILVRLRRSAMIISVVHHTVE
jgi:hypothetical protein